MENGITMTIMEEAMGRIMDRTIIRAQSIHIFIEVFMVRISNTILYIIQVCKVSLTRKQNICDKVLKCTIWYQNVSFVDQ